MLTLKMKKVRPGAIIPKRATSGSAGLDLCACTENEVVLKAGERTVIPTGIAIAIENNETAAFVYARSGLGIKHGISLSNGVGVIDSDYRGEICVGLINTSNEEYYTARRENRSACARACHSGTARRSRQPRRDGARRGRIRLNRQMSFSFCCGRILPPTRLSRRGYSRR